MSGQGLIPPPSEWQPYYHSESATAGHREGERGEGERERGRVRGYKVQNPGSAGVHEQGEQRGGGGA